MTNDHALVLGGGVAGIAWMTGLLTGLAKADQDVTGADLLIGTPAGATVVGRLRSAGSQVTVIVPDEASAAAIGANPLDPGTRTPAALAGRDQGRAGLR